MRLTDDRLAVARAVERAYRQKAECDYGSIDVVRIITALPDPTPLPAPTGPGWWWARHWQDGWELVWIASVEGRAIHLKRIGRGGTYAGRSYVEFVPGITLTPPGAEP